MATAVSLQLAGQSWGRQFNVAAGRFTKRIEDRLERAADQAAEEIKKRCDDDISSAGNFSSRWTDALTVTKVKTRTEIKITVRMQIDYWRVFQDGGEISGHPYLWLPLSDAKPGPIAEFPNGLSFVQRRGGRPLLIDTSSHKPAYVGVDRVKIPKLFHLVEICQDVSDSLPVYYREA